MADPHESLQPNSAVEIMSSLLSLKQQRDSFWIPHYSILPFMLDFLKFFFQVYTTIKEDSRQPNAKPYSCLLAISKSFRYAEPANSVMHSALDCFLNESNTNCLPTVVPRAGLTQHECWCTSLGVWNSGSKNWQRREYCWFEKSRCQTRMEKSQQKWAIKRYNRDTNWPICSYQKLGSKSFWNCKSCIQWYKCFFLEQLASPLGEFRCSFVKWTNNQTRNFTNTKTFLRARSFRNWWWNGNFAFWRQALDGGSKWRKEIFLFYSIRELSAGHWQIHTRCSWTPNQADAFHQSFCFAT